MNLNPSVYHMLHLLNIMCASDRQRELRLVRLHAFTRTNKTSVMWHRVCAENSTTEHWNAMHMILVQVKRLHFTDDSICTLQAHFIKIHLVSTLHSKNMSNRIWCTVIWINCTYNCLFIYCFYLYFFILPYIALCFRLELMNIYLKLIDNALAENYQYIFWVYELITYLYVAIFYNTHTHTHIHTYIYTYTHIYVCVCARHTIGHIDTSIAKIAENT